jgi:hypothetical protein
MLRALKRFIKDGRQIKRSRRENNIRVTNERVIKILGTPIKSENDFSPMFRQDW